MCFRKIRLVFQMILDHAQTGEPVRLFTKHASDSTLEYYYNNKLFMRIDNQEDILESERQMYRNWLMYHFQLSDIEIKGEALKKVPHGFVCIHGSRDAMERFAMMATKPVYLFLIGTRTDLEDRLRRAFELKEEPDFRGIIRMNFIYEKLNDSVSDYVLLIRENENRLTIPGGKRHIGESSVDCATRELFEETGIQCEITSSPVYNEECRANYYLITII